jgi:hypothetical protein
LGKAAADLAGCEPFLFRAPPVVINVKAEDSPSRQRMINGAAAKKSSRLRSKNESASLKAQHQHSGHTEQQAITEFKLAC